MFKIASVSGAPPQTPLGAYDATPDPLIVRGFLPSAIAASGLRRLHFPQFFQYLLFPNVSNICPPKVMYRLTPLYMGPLLVFL